MSKLTWDNEGERLFETGVSEVALYPFQTNGYTKGVAWNGVSSITDSPGGAVDCQHFFTDSGPEKERLLRGGGGGSDCPLRGDF